MYCNKNEPNKALIAKIDGNRVAITNPKKFLDQICDILNNKIEPDNVVAILGDIEMQGHMDLRATHTMECTPLLAKGSDANKNFVYGVKVSIDCLIFEQHCVCGIRPGYSDVVESGKGGGLVYKQLVSIPTTIRVAELE